MDSKSEEDKESNAIQLVSPNHPSSAATTSSPAVPIQPVRTSADYHTDDEDDLLDSDDAAALLDSESTAVQRARAGSLSFDFSNRILLSSTDETGRNLPSYLNNGHKISEKITLSAGIALIVGMQIGSGIFSSPGVVAKETGSVGSALILWVGAGLLSWAGASSFAELGSALPMNGGQQAYLSAAFGPLPAYCFSFTAVTALKPGGQAIICVIFGEYLSRVLFLTAFSKDPKEAAKGVPDLAVKGVAILGLVAVSALQAWSAKAGTRAQLVLTIFKVAALVMVFVGGLVFLGLGRAASNFSFGGSSSNPAGYALALFSALWTFDGWDQCNYVSKDIAPGSLPIMINSSLATVLCLFVAANASYFLVLPFTIATATSTIGLDFGRAIAGPIGGVLFALVVSISCLGALNGGVYTTSRLVVAAAEQGFLPKWFAKYSDKQQTPVNGIVLSSGLSIIFILLGDFTHLTLFYGVIAWTWNLAVVVGLLVLRVREPSLRRPYRTFLATPIAFCSTALFLIVLSCFSKPWESLAAFIFSGAGVVPYYIQQERAKKAEAARQAGLEMT